MARLKNSKYLLSDETRRRARRKTIMWYLLGGLVIALVSLLLFIPWTGNASLGANLIGTVVTPLQSGVDSLISKVEEFAATWSYNQNLELEYNRLKERVSILETENDQLTEYMQENERLRELLGYAEKYPDLESVQARVIARDPSNWYSMITINRGQMHGISQDMIVVNADGLIGRITEVGYNYSKVMCIIDARSSVSGIVERTRDVGVISSVMEGQTVHDNILVMNYLPSDTDLRPGDIIKTGGMDRIYPKGITLGTISEISRSGSSREVVVSPSVDFLHLEDVLVIAGDPDRALEEID